MHLFYPGHYLLHGLATLSVHTKKTLKIIRREDGEKDIVRYACLLACFLAPKSFPESFFLLLIFPFRQEKRSYHMARHD